MKYTERRLSDVRVAHVLFAVLIVGIFSIMLLASCGANASTGDNGKDLNQYVSRVCDGSTAVYYGDSGISAVTNSPECRG